MPQLCARNPTGLAKGGVRLQQGGGGRIMSQFIPNQIFCPLHVFLYWVDLNWMAASLPSLLISLQELLYAVKVESIDSLLTKPSSEAISMFFMD